MTFDPITVREIATRSLTDPRTVAKFLRGERVMPLVGVRLRRVMRRLGLAPPAPSPPPKVA